MKFMDNTEVWKDIKNWEGYYQISNFGRVRSLDREINHSHKGKCIQKRILEACFIKDLYARFHNT